MSLEKWDELFQTNKLQIPNRKVLHSTVVSNMALSKTIRDYIDYIFDLKIKKESRVQNDKPKSKPKPKSNSTGYKGGF